jgi:hypothetical protein
VQHFGVAPEQSESDPHCCWQSAVGAQTVCVEAWLAWQHDSPAAVLHALSSEQNRGQLEGVTHALSPPP